MQKRTGDASAADTLDALLRHDRCVLFICFVLFGCYKKNLIILLFYVLVNLNRCCLCLFKCSSACLVLAYDLSESVVEMICVIIKRLSQTSVYESRRLTAGRLRY